ncbi:hypothetical protein M758_1G177400 [Ceratodon purpureus]|nr:hypothetical protein M758_1G177400 [Ceratodon purpureus]
MWRDFAYVAKCARTSSSKIAVQGWRWRRLMEFGAWVYRCRAVLPVAWAFSITGITAGFLIMVVVASANAYTCDLLLRQAFATGCMDFETLGLAVGGRAWRLTTEISIVVLLLGTITGSIAQVGEAGAIGLTSIWPNTPGALINGSGRLLMVLATAVVIWPLCLVSRLRQLEYAGMAGTVIVLWLVGVTVVEASINDLPAVRDGEFAAVGLSSIGLVSQAVSVFGFAFYIQPVIMPLLEEMPAGQLGVKLTSYSTRVVVLVNSFVIYGLTGFFGAAMYGTSTESNILVNQWLGGGVAQGILNLSMTFYLAMALPMLEFPTRHTIDGWIPERWATNKRLRHLVVMTAIVVFCLVIAVAWPASSGYILVVTGATGVCMVSYIIPVVNHLLLYYSRSKIQKLRKMENERDPESKQFQLIVYRKERKPGTIWYIVEVLREIFLPVLVLAVGIFCSVASLTTL